MKNQLQKFREYLDYIERHYDNVQKAWATINKECAHKNFRFLYDDFVWGLINENIKNHDLSKLSSQEFTQYRQFFFPADGEEKNKELMNTAWSHHCDNNHHHWQNWTATQFADPYSAEIYLVENIVDWMAMGYEFGDTAKEYYEKMKGEINFPEWAVKLMYEIFDCVYQEK